MEFSRQEYWSGLLFPSPGDLPLPVIEPGSPALQADSLQSEPPGSGCVFLKTAIALLVTITTTFIECYHVPVSLPKIFTCYFLFNPRSNSMIEALLLSHFTNEETKAPKG